MAPSLAILVIALAMMPWAQAICVPSSSAGCCNGTQFALANQTCCAGTVYNISADHCCGVLFNATIETCCQNNTVVTPLGQCCSDVACASSCCVAQSICCAAGSVCSASDTCEVPTTTSTSTSTSTSTTTSSSSSGSANVTSISTSTSTTGSATTSSSSTAGASSTSGSSSTTGGSGCATSTLCELSCIKAPKQTAAPTPSRLPNSTAEPPSYNIITLRLDCPPPPDTCEDYLNCCFIDLLVGSTGGAGEWYLCDEGSGKARQPVLKKKNRIEFTIFSQSGDGVGQVSDGEYTSALVNIGLSAACNYADPKTSCEITPSQGNSFSEVVSAAPLGQRAYVLLSLCSSIALLFLQ